MKSLLVALQDYIKLMLDKTSGMKVEAYIVRGRRYIREKI